MSSRPSRMSGVLAPVITPFRDDLGPDSQRLIQHCRWLLSQNAGLAVFGTNSEANSLSVTEKTGLLESLLDAGIDPARMMPGTGCCALTDSIDLTRKAVELGCGGVLMLPPFYYKAVSDEGLFASYSEIIQRVGSEDLQIYLYHIPPIAKVGLSLDLVERLVETYPDTIAGIKDSSGDWQNTAAILDRQWPDFRVFPGSESFLLRGMESGGAGCISATANINPGAIDQLYQRWDSIRASQLQEQLDRVRDQVQRLPMIAALKRTVAHFANDPDWQRVRPPLEPLSQAQSDQLLKGLEELGFDMPGLTAA